MIFRKSLFIAPFLCVLSACAPTPVVTTTAFQPNQANINGIPYFLPLAQIPLTISNENGGPKVTLEEMVLTADASAALLANINLSSLSNDDVSIGTTNTGLLDFLTVSSDNVTDEIVSSTAAAVQSLAQSNAANLRAEAKTAGDPVRPGRHFLDPFEPLQNPSAAAQRQATTGQRVALHSHLNPTFGSATILYHDRDLAHRVQNANGARSNTCQPDTSLCFPALTRVTVRVSGQTFELEETYAIPDPTRSFGIAIDRRACVLSTYTLQISNGVLTRFSTNSPSEVAGCLSIPVDIISSIVAAPINAIRGQTTGLDAQIKLIEAQTRLITAQNSLQSAGE